MDDRALLERAAAAAGYEVARVADDGESLMLVGMQEPWNPRRDDGQALRLAVKLNLMIVIRPSDVRCNSWGSTDKRREFLTGKTDPCAATRRAITRAAAALAVQQEGARNVEG